MTFRHEGLSLLLHQRHFRSLWLGSVISGLGNELGEAAVLWMVLRITHSPADVGLIALCVGVPGAIVYPFAGVLGDRYARSRLMAVGNVILAFIYGAIAVTSQFGLRWIWLSYLLLALGSTALPLTRVGRSQLIAEMLPAHQWTAANFFDDVYLHITWLVGPALAGLSVSWLGYGPVLAFDAISFLLCAGFLFTIPSSLHTASIPCRQLVENLLDGVRMLRRKRVLMQLAVLTFFFNLFFGVYAIVLPMLAYENFGGATAYGLLWSTFAVGSFIGGILFSSQLWKWPIGISMAMVIVLWGTTTCILTFAHAYWLILVIMLVNGFIYTPYEPLYHTVIQQTVPLRMQAKLSSTIQPLTSIGQPVGSWLSGLLASPLGLGGLLMASGVATVFVGCSTFVMPGIRRYVPPKTEARSCLRKIKLRTEK